MSFKSMYQLFVMNSNEEVDKIYQNRFNSEASFHFDFVINHYPSFYFNHNEIIFTLLQIKSLDMALTNLFNSLPPLAYSSFIKECLIQEIVSNNAIEGVISSKKDVFSLIEELKVKSAHTSSLESIVNKYLILLNQNKIKLDSPSDIRKLYEELLEKEISSSDKNNLLDGTLFRKNPVYIYSPSGKIIHQGIYPEEKIISSLEEALKILKEPRLDPYVKISIFHYLFAYIHPFYDGNGRMDRFITSYLLVNNSSNSLAFSLSNTIQAHLKDYYEAFTHTNDIRNKGDLTTFVYTFLNLILTSYQDIQKEIEAKQEIYLSYLTKVDKLNLESQEKKLVQLLLESEVFSTSGTSKLNLMKELNLKSSSVASLINKLKIKKLLKTYHYGKYVYYGLNLNNI